MLLQHLIKRLFKIGRHYSTEIFDTLGIKKGTHMSRYSRLKPLDIEERKSICAKMLHLFGLDFKLKEEARAFLNIQHEQHVDRPFSLDDFIKFFTHKDGYDYGKIRAQIIEIARKL